ncbi:PREDICTED: p53 and DNA damage-regulated protein 1-like [Acropora digitifera]|uniref:p53 and DNA damage-regulated protein 1-like n=1 Tax=Acropora digitifera TaxID=70779 RepID=UPI00077A74FA|nr:PREDICTED: p53 and DNA damage-regulated protein 1-like [Acropora digitifera]
MAERSLTSVSLQKFTELEELAEEIIEDKHQGSCVRTTNNWQVTCSEMMVVKWRQPTLKWSSKSWVCIGNIFVKLPNSHVQEMLQQDHKSLDVEISKLRSDLKPKVSKLHELEGLPEVKGFDLTALTQDDFLNLQA